MTPLQKIYVSLTLVSFFWGTSFAAAKIGMEQLLPMNLAIFRFVLASLLFSLLLFIQKGNNKLDIKDIPQFAILGFMAITSYFYLQYTGLLYTTTIHSSLIIATSPIMTAVFGICLGWEAVSRLKAVGILLAFTGVILIITNGDFYSVLQSTSFLGDLMLLANAVVWAGFTLYGKKILQKYKPFTAMAYIHIFGTLLMLPLAFWSNPVTPQTFFEQIPAITNTTIFSAFYLALLCSVYSYYVWYWAVEKIGAVRTSVFSYLNPLFAIIAGIWLLDEIFTVYILLGGVMVIIGVYLTNHTQNQQIGSDNLKHAERKT